VIAEIRAGDWVDALADVESCDAVIMDPPYGARTHKGATTERKDRYELKEIEYGPMTPQKIAHLIGYWAKRTRRWIAVMTSHDLIPAYEQAFAVAGWYGFAPVGVVQRNAPRIQGDGPACNLIYLMVGRPKTPSAMAWRSLPGSYVTTEQGGGGGRGKPISLMERIVCDYSNPGDLIIDPFAGWGSTGVACVHTRRDFIGAEIDADAHAIAVERVSGATPGLPGVSDMRHEQIKLKL
jgi:hypothetical protein